jgi:predicted anti-sigma-YlaC factor YlaD
MACEIYKPLLMGYLDQELTESDLLRVEQHLQECSDCPHELSGFRKLKEITQNMRLVMPDEKVWEAYWSNIYNRLERQIGWILVSIGSILLGAYLLYKVAVEAFLDASLPLIVRIGVIALLVGLCTLLVSVLRERIFLARRDKYERIKR